MITASASAVGPPPGMRVRLSSNESAIGPSPAAVEAAQRAVQDAHWYPDDQAIALRSALAAAEGRAVDEVVVGTGSAALLMDGIAHLAVGGSVLAFERSFIVYRLAAANVGAEYVEAATAGPPGGSGAGYARDVDELLRRLDGSTKVIVVDNPGNPTGAHLTSDQLERLVASVPPDVTVIIDEAYHHFADGQRGYGTATTLAVEHSNVLVVRTFSKAYALAGLRVGYMIGAAETVGAIDARRPRFNVTAPAQAAAVAALEDTAHMRAAVATAIEGRAVMADGLSSIGVPFTDGLGNFLTIELGIASPSVVAAFADQGVGVRSLEPYGMNEQIRVSIGTPDEVAAFLAAAGDVLVDVPSTR